jgi:hypothetical protein
MALVKPPHETPSTALRLGELLGLRWGDVNFDAERARRAASRNDLMCALVV